jgi:plastocyanin
MRTLRLRPVLSVAPAARSALLGLGALALPAVAIAQGAPAADTKVKYVYKPVACTPCPCECPDPKTIPTVAAGSSSPVQTPVREPSRERDPLPERPSPSGEPAGRPPIGGPPGLARGDIGGSVVVRQKGGAERADRSNVVVYIESMPKKYAALKKVRAMAQRDKSFVPSVIAITKGSSVDFPNEDKFFHNVFSLSEGNTFDLGLYRAGESKSVTFERTGVVDVYCNIHPQMWAQILVLENPFFTTSNRDGSFELPKVPPGQYSVAAWIQGGSPVRQQVKVEPGKRAMVNLDITEGAKYQQHNNKENKPYGRYQ